MKINGQYQRKVLNDDGNYEITFVVADYQSKKQVEELQKQAYKLDVKKPKSKRSLNQNAFLWKIIGELSKAMEADDINIYCLLLEEAKAKTTDVTAPAEAEKMLLRASRVVRILRYEDFDKNIAHFRCYDGSSTFTIKEMNKLIDIALIWCSENDIKMEEYTYEFDNTK